MEDKITNAQLSKLIESIATNLAQFLGEFMGFRDEVTTSQNNMHESLQELRQSMRELQEGALTREEKEAVLAMVGDYGRWLEEDVGYKSINADS